MKFHLEIGKLSIGVEPLGVREEDIPLTYGPLDRLKGWLLYDRTGLVWQGHSRALHLQKVSRTISPAPYLGGEPRIDEVIGGRRLITIARPLFLVGETNWAPWDHRSFHREPAPDGVHRVPSVPSVERRPQGGTRVHSRSRTSC